MKPSQLDRVELECRASHLNAEGEKLEKAEDKYIYFLLAAAGAAITLATQRTIDAALDASQIPLGLAVLFWGLSFYAGCRNRQRTLSGTFEKKSALVERKSRFRLTRPSFRMMRRPKSNRLSKAPTTSFPASIKRREKLSHERASGLNGSSDFCSQVHFVLSVGMYFKWRYALIEVQAVRQSEVP